MSTAAAIPTSVTATAFGPWPGDDIVEACRIVQGELGAPNLPILPLLPARGVGAEAIGRTAAMLVDLPVDIQPYGWRLVQRPGADQRRAQSLLNSDINVLADVVGGLDSKPPQLKTQVLGPFSLAANVHLPLGERVLSDHGARRDLVESLALGIAAHLRALQRAAPGTALCLHIDEPEILAILAGSVPTISGYRTLRAVPHTEVRSAWTLLVAAARAAGAAEVVLAVPLAAAELATQSGADGVALTEPVQPGSVAAYWETIAALVEADKAVLLPVSAGKAGPAAAGIWRPWRAVGLPASRLAALRIFEAAPLSEVSPEVARKSLTELTDVVDAIQELVAAD